MIIARMLRGVIARILRGAVLRIGLRMMIKNDNSKHAERSSIKNENSA
jgi:hypothetical protein